MCMCMLECEIRVFLYDHHVFFFCLRSVQQHSGQTYSDNAPQYSGGGYGYSAPPPSENRQLESGSIPPNQGFETPKKVAWKLNS